VTDLSWLTRRPIAHRGLHDRDAGRPENSMAAFAAALDGEYAIECDLQFSADSQPVVFHDDMLDRLTDDAGPVKDRPAIALQKIALSGSQETIPLLADLLALVAGKVPLIVEMKDNGECNIAFAEAVADGVKDYTGPLAVMSLDHAILDALGHADGSLPRGLVAKGGWRMAARHLRAMIRLKLDFMTYKIVDLPTLAPWICRYILRRPLLCWTVRTDADHQSASRRTDQITFEGFRP
jgi:glycerophosphoryl diester phosphodiesterase